MTTPANTNRLKRRNHGKGHSYQIDGRKVIGVTTALNAKSKPALVGWAANTTAGYAVDNWDTLADLPPSERLKKLEGARWDVLRAASLRGTEIHALGEQLSKGVKVDVPDALVGAVEGYARWLDAWDITVLATETPLGNSRYLYGGTADLWATIGKLGNIPALIDLKSGKGIYEETPLQAAAYRYHDLIHIDGDEREGTPALEVADVFVAHIKPDVTDMKPITADADTFKQFCYVLAVHRDDEFVKDEPRVGRTIYPDERPEPGDAPEWTI